MIPKSSNIVDLMTDNPSFPTPEPPIAEVKKVMDEFSLALTKAESGTSLDTIIKNQKRKALEAVLGRLALYVQLASKEDPAVLTSSGFELVKSRTTVGVLSKPSNFKVVPGVGIAKLSVKSVQGAKSYAFSYTEAPVVDGAVWLTKTAATTTTVIDLPSGKRYAFRVHGVGTDPTVTHSDVITSFIL